MRTENAVGAGRAPTQPVWTVPAARLEGHVALELRRHDDGRRVRVEVLGHRDEHDVTTEESWCGQLPLHLLGHQALVGPADDGCPRCLARRWQAARPRELRDALELGEGTRAAGSPAVLTAFVVDHLAAVAAATTWPSSDSGADAHAAVRVVDLDQLLVQRVGLVPDPECPGCAAPDPVTRAQSELRLEPAPKPAPDVFRGRDLLDHDLPARAFANPVCGAVGPVLVTDVASLTTAATAGGFTTRSGTYLRLTHWGGHADSYARSSRIGILEGLERYAGIRARTGATKVVAALDDLGTAALDPRDCGLYDPEFYAHHPEVEPFDPARPISWVPGHSLRDDRTLLVPEVLAHYQTPDQRCRFVQSTSSGCASGGSLTEAVLHGLMESVERDSFLIAWYAGLSLPELDAATSRRAETRQMVDRLAMYGYDARFFDTRIDLSIPVVTAVAVRRDGGPGALCVGGGASPDPESALVAALCEIATDAVNLRHRTLQDEDRLRAMSIDFDLVAELHDHPLSYGIPEMAEHAAPLLAARGPARPMSSYVDAPPLHEDLHDDLAWCLDQVIGRGFDVVVVDQTLPEQRRLGLATVNVIVPGLVPIDFGWDRQRALHLPRVRTAPQAAGLRDHVLTTDELHRVPHPFP
jgi:ribosomal protein S12 methylthiotransferase accessory factor